VRTLPLTACPVCRATGTAEEPLGLVACAECGTVRAREYADPEEVFREGYLAGGTGRFGIDLSHPRWQEYLALIGDRRCAVLPSPGPGGTLLDVGCGSGEFLAAAARRGWEVTGVEPIPDAAQRARDRGLRVLDGTLAEAAPPERAHDLVTAFHVLEHQPDAVAFLGELGRYARPGGHVAVEVPNFASALRHATGDRWPHLRPLEHLVHFTPATLRAALAGAGLEPVTVVSRTWAAPLQTLDEALADLALPRLRRPLAPLSPYRDVAGSRARVPAPPAFAVLRAAGALRDRRGQGVVAVGIARVP
jgi:2-polyprenyl-3-methyl-5-hydroxy-6-metoxy-1,4-benzoquinol methylase